MTLTVGRGTDHKLIAVLTVVLTDDLLPISGSDDGAARVRQIVCVCKYGTNKQSNDPRRPIFVVKQPRASGAFRASMSAHATAQQAVPGAVTLQTLRAFLSHQPISESDLLQSYYTQHHPAISLLPEGTTPPMLLGAVLTAAMNHSSTTRHIAAASASLVMNDNGPNDHSITGIACALIMIDLRPINNSLQSYILLAKVRLLMNPR